MNVDIVDRFLTTKKTHQHSERSDAILTQTFESVYQKTNIDEHCESAWSRWHRYSNNGNTETYDALYGEW